jgi:hypothetical protein
MVDCEQEGNESTNDCEKSHVKNGAGGLKNQLQRIKPEPENLEQSYQQTGKEFSNSQNQSGCSSQR